jgi:hypothetical protein
MASSSTADFPLENQEEPVYLEKDSIEVAEQALQYSIMDQLEEADIPEGDETEEEDKNELPSSIMDQTANAVIEEYCPSETSSKLYVDCQCQVFSMLCNDFAVSNFYQKKTVTVTATNNSEGISFITLPFHHATAH